MKPPVNVEEVLARMGQDWPAGDSLVEGVLRGLERVPRRPGPKRVRRWVLRSVPAIAASVVALFVFWSVLKSGATVYAQARDAVHRARTFQMIVRTMADGEKPEEPVLTVSYERGIGFREEGPTEVLFGNPEGWWRYSKHAKLAIRSKGDGLAALVDRALDDSGGTVGKDVEYAPYAAGDQIVDGRPCHAFLRTKVGDQWDRALKARGERMVLLLDDQSRVARIVTEARSQDRWVARIISDWKYDIPLDRSLFQPRFPADVRVVDAAAAFERYVDLDKAIYREERQGLWYAIHHAERIENGGLFVVSSVRGTDDTLKKYPLTRRRLQPGMIFVDGPAHQYRGSQDPRVPGNVVDLAAVDHDGINVSWWVLIPHAHVGDAPFEVGPGRVKIPVGITPTGGAYGKAILADAAGVLQPLTWDVELAMAQPKPLPSLDAIARQVYADVDALEGVPFKFLNLGNRGLSMSQWSDLKKISVAQFTAAVADDVRWWKDGSPLDDPRSIELRKDPAGSN
jgi:hypothetical protein